jgi:LPS-assembly protein
VFSRIAFLAAALLALPLRAQNPLEVTSDGPSSLQNGETVLNKARATDGELVLTADEFRLPPGRRDIVMAGHVVLTYGAIRLLADRLVYHRTDGRFEAERVRLGAFPYFAEAESATGTLKEITLSRATATYGEPSPWHPTMIADKIVYTPGQRLRSENSRIGVGHAQPLPLPRLTQNLKQPFLSNAALTGGFRRSLGLFAEAGVHVPTPSAPGLKLGGDVGIYTSRGLMFGPSGTYEREFGDDRMAGSFRSGYINDHGDKKTDILGQPVPEERAYAEWQHRQSIGEHLTLTAQLHWWRDSEILRDFRPRAFFPVQQPDTFAEATYAGQNYFFSFFTRYQPNDFGLVQERLPELRFDLLPVALGGGFYQRFNASIAFLRDYPAPLSLPICSFGPLGMPGATGMGWRMTGIRRVAQSARRTARFDAYYALERPITPTDWFAFTPIAGARVTHYHGSRAPRVIVLTSLPPIYHFSDLALPTYTRTLGELGFDSVLRSSGTFDYKNALWKIDGLRHLFTPRLSYRHIPHADRGNSRLVPPPDRIPQIDRQTFSTYLPPLGLGDQRNLDDLRATNALRLGFDNTLQTRDSHYGSRDLVTLNVANDFRFAHLRGERPTSEIHTELAVMPARWLEASIYQSVTSNNLTLREFNTALTLRDGDRWSVRFANNFLRHELEDCAVDGRFRLHERFDALTRLHYDQRKRRFTEQAYGLVQNLDNTWRVSYVVSLHEGRARENRFGLSLQVEAIGF